MGKIAYITDKLSNLVANLGTARDKASHSKYAAPVVTDADLINAYRGAWLPRKIVDIPALDACRKWRSWQADKEQITKIEAEEKRLGLQKKTMEALTKARLFGGAAIYIGTGDADPAQPMRDNAQVRHLTVLTRRQLTAGTLEINPESPRFNEPAYYTIANTAQTVHPSRLVIFKGAQFPDEEMATALEYGWGDSVLTAMFEALLNADSTTANIASLTFEAKVDVIKIPDFMAGLEDPNYERLVLDRLTLAAMAKGVNGALLLDSLEEYQQKSANFSSLKDILMAYMQIAAGAADIPMTRLLGQSPGGLQSTGDADTRNYYDKISASQELEMTPALELLDNMLIRQALGTRPPDVWYKWSSLWQTTDKEQSEIGKATAEMIKTLSDTKLIPEDALSSAAVTVLTERGVMPGLEQAVEDSSMEIGSDPAEDGAETRRITADAAPRPLYVNRKVLNGEEIKAWAKSQGIESVSDDLHVTIAFSREPVDWMKAGRAWDENSDGSIRIAPGGPRDIDKLGENAIVLLFASDELSWRHERIKDAGASWDWAEYQPHITITYSEGIDPADIEPYRGPIVLGPEIFEALDLDWREKVTES